jgi:long-subunit fatty acid transport protein
VVYLEAAYRMTSHWQVAARYEYATYDVPSLVSLPVPDSIYDHQEMIVGLNYWLNPNLVVKCSYHLIKGNRLAFPETVMDYLQSLQQGSFEEQTNLILIGVQFSF